MHRTVWRVLALLSTLAIGFALSAVPAQAASGWQPAWNQAYANSSARDNGAVIVSDAEYLAVVQNRPAACGHADDNGYWAAPDVPASVLADIKADRSPKKFHKTTTGAFHYTANGSLGIYYRSDKAGRVDEYLPELGGIHIVTSHYMNVRRAWVAGFRGAGCDVWTEIQTSR